MMYGSLIFLGSVNDIKRVNDIIDDLLDECTSSYSSPYDFDLADSSGVLYKVDFSGEQWINIIEKDDYLRDLGIKVDIIHALTDGATMIEVISTNPAYDDYTVNPNKIHDLSKLYMIKMTDISDIIDEDSDDIEDEIESDFYDE